MKLEDQISAQKFWAASIKARKISERRVREIEHRKETIMFLRNIGCKVKYFLTERGYEYRVYMKNEA